MALLDSGTLQGLWRTPKTNTGSLLKASQRLPRAMPARVTMGMGLKHPHSPNDPFLAKLAAAASTEMGKAQLAGATGVSENPPLLDVLMNPTMMAAPAQVPSAPDFAQLFAFFRRILSWWIKQLEYALVGVMVFFCVFEQVERSSGYNEHRPRRPPPDLPSLLLNSRIVYIGMPVSLSAP